MESEQEAAGQDAPVAKPVLTVAKGQDRIPSDKPLEELVTIHGTGSVYVDGKCYAQILVERQAADSAAKLADEAPPGAADESQSTDPEQPVGAAPAVNAAEGAGDLNA